MFVYAAFSGIVEARKFVALHGGGDGGGYNSSEKTSATWTPSGVGKKAKVTIEKTGAAYKGRCLYGVHTDVGKGGRQRPKM